MGFIGNFADLTGHQFGSFTVQSLAGRDRQNAPRWTVVCGSCTLEQVLPHAKLAPLLNSKAADNLYCASQSCIASRKQHIDSESLTDIRRRERREAEKAAAQAAREAAERNAAAERQRVEKEKLDALRREYLQYWNHQVKTSASDADIVTIDRWRQLLPSTRQMVLARLRADPTLYFTGL